MMVRKKNLRACRPLCEAFAQATALVAHMQLCLEKQHLAHASQVF
jgi:hypothetical protein